MTTFPTLTPSTRTYSPGAFPHTAHRVYDGSEARVRHSSTVLGARLRLFFPALTTAELLTVIAHYNGQRGRFLPFAIPVELLSGTATPATFTPAGHQWRYAAKPTAEDISVNGTTPSNLHNLTVELETVPPENSIVQGVRLRVRTELRAGSAQLGVFFDMFASLDAGGAESLREFEEFMIATLTAGAATGLPLLTAVMSLTAGAASSAVPFDPLDLSPLAWWDASDASTVTISSGRVSGWDDKSGNGWHLSQADSGRRPVHSAAAINGLDAMDWDDAGANPWMQSASGTFTAEEFYFVARHGNIGFFNFEGLFNPADNSVNGWFTGSNLGDQNLFFDVPTYVNGGATDEQADLFPALTTTCLVRCQRTSGTFTTTAGVVVGFDRLNTGLPRRWPGFICEGLAFSTALSSGDRTDLETHLMDKWDV